MGPTLILIALPSSNVVIGKTRIFIRTTEDQGMNTCLDAHSIVGLIGESWLQPKARKGIASHVLTIELIVLEKRQCLGIDGESLGVVGREVIVSSRHPCGQFLSMKAQGTD